VASTRIQDMSDRQLMVTGRFHHGAATAMDYMPKCIPEWWRKQASEHDEE